LNVLLLEDEEYNREFLKKLLSEIPVVNKVFACSDSKEAIQLAREHNPDLALLDIELNDDEVNGLAVARDIYRLCPETGFVFVTAYSKYALDSFEVHPYDYILKPIKIKRFIEVIENFANRPKEENLKEQILVIKLKNETIHIRKKDIVFIEVQNNISFIHTREDIFKAQQALGEFEEILGEDFLRVHKSFIVRLDQINKIRQIFDRSYEIEFFDYPQKALMSRYKYREYKEKFGI
jgi:two-component system LytT family response regulator